MAAPNDNTVALLNVGLEWTDSQGTARRHSRQYVLNTAKLFGIRTLEDVIVESDTEETLVIRGVVRNLAFLQLFAEYLEQDCIAVWNIEEQSGSLTGPRAEKWGEFDPHLFFCLDGSRLDAHLFAEGEA